MFNAATKSVVESRWEERYERSPQDTQSSRVGTLKGSSLIGAV